MMYVTVLFGLFAALMTGSIAQYDVTCVAGQQPGFPWNFDPCITCVSLDGLTLCNVGEVGCIWGSNPADPVCAPVPTMAPVTNCHPDDIQPTIDPFVASFLGGQPCLVCLNIYTLQRCLGTGGEICDWKGCSEEIVPNRICEPGSELEIPTFPRRCNLKCVNSDSQDLCVASDTACNWSEFDLSCTRNEPEIVTVDPCPSACSPGSVFVPIPDLFPECRLECRNIDTDELCVNGDRCCVFDEFYYTSCLGVSPRPTSSTTMPEPVCQPEDTPPIPREIACYKCLSRNGKACVPNSYCEWREVDDALCKSTEPTDPPTESSFTTLTTTVKDVTSKQGRFSVTFKHLTCKIVNGKREEAFIRSFTQQILSMIGSHPVEIELLCGSLIVEFTLVKEENDQFDMEDLSEKLKQEVENGQLNVKFDGQEYTASAFKNITRKSNQPTADPLTYVFWFLVVGVIAVVIVALFMVIVFAYLDYHCRQQRGKVPPIGSNNNAYTDWELKPKRTSDVSHFEEEEDSIFGDGYI